MSTLHNDHRDVLIAPVVSEKSYACMDRGQYTFIVAPGSHKTEIKQAVEAMNAAIIAATVAATADDVIAPRSITMSVP